MAKRLLPMFLACFLLAAGLLSAVSAAGDDIVASGDCSADGSNVKWALDNKGNLSISGTGVMSDYGRSGATESDVSYAPWYGNRDMITSLTVKNGVTIIGTNAFWGLKNLSKVTLPDSVIRIKEAAFGWCAGLTSITFPDSVSSLEMGALYHCYNLLSFTISDNVTNIGQGVFVGCNRLTSLIIPENVADLGPYAFRNCDKLQSVTILGNIPTIKPYTFEGCPALTQVTVPGSVAIIQGNAFSGCNALKDVYFTGTADMWKAISVDDENEPLNGATIHYDTSPDSAYRINALTISDSDGKPLSAIPNGSFLATVSVTNRASGTSPLVFLAAYSDGGKFQDFMYVTVKEPIGSTVEVTLPIDNSAGNIAELHVFAVSSFSDLAPLGASVSFPVSPRFLV